MAYTRETQVASQTFTANPSGSWNRNTGTWTSNGSVASCSSGSNEGGYQYLAADTTYPFGTVTATATQVLNSGMFIAGSAHAGAPTTGVYFGYENDPVSGQPMVFLQVMGVSTSAQNSSAAYGLRSERPVQAGWLGSTQTLVLTLAYGSAWVKVSGSNYLVIRLTFGNMLSADVKDSIEAVSPRAGMWQKTTASGFTVTSATVVQANSRLQTSVDTPGAVYAHSFTATVNPWAPNSGYSTLQSPWIAAGAPAVNKLYTSGGQLYINTDAASGERVNYLSNTTIDSNFYSAHLAQIWVHYVGGYSIGFAGTDTWRVAVYADPVTGSTFGNYYRNG